MRNTFYAYRRFRPRFRSSIQMILIMCHSQPVNVIPYLICICNVILVSLYTSNGRAVLALVLQSITLCVLSVNANENGVIHSIHLSFVSNANIFMRDSVG